MWVERYLFNPSLLQRFISFLLLPISALYCIVAYLKFKIPKKQLNIPIISIGNLIVGGSGKTPVSIAIANKFPDGAVVLRGYKRDSKGCIVVKHKHILTDVKTSGDEAMEIALKADCIVIVSEDREVGILQAQALGAKYVILDDGFDKPFEKLNIVIDLKIRNHFCLPSGGYRYSRWFLRYADIILEENKNFYRRVVVPTCDDCVLVSAISKPERLFKYLDIDKYQFFLDHHKYTKDELNEILHEYNAKSILTTYKDYVKMKDFGLDIKIIDLEVKLADEIEQQIQQYIKSAHGH